MLENGKVCAQVVHYSTQEKSLPFRHFARHHLAFRQLFYNPTITLL